MDCPAGRCMLVPSSTMTNDAVLHGVIAAAGGQHAAAVAGNCSPCASVITQAVGSSPDSVAASSSDSPSKRVTWRYVPPIGAAHLHLGPVRAAAAAAAAYAHPAATSPVLPRIIISPVHASTWGSAVSTPASDLVPEAAPSTATIMSIPHALSSMSTQDQARLAYEVALTRRLTRHRFLRKVYALLAAQLLLVVLLASHLARIKPLRKFLQSAPWAAALPAVLLVLVLIILACSTTARSALPVNMVNLGVLTAVMGLQLAAVSAAWATRTLVLGTLLTAANLLVLSAHSLQLASDVTFAGSCIWVAGTLLVLVPVAHLQLHVSAVRCCIAGCAALSLASCVAYDVHLMANGHHVHQQQQLGAGVFGVLNLYTDPITLLLVLLSRQQEQSTTRRPLLHC